MVSHLAVDNVALMTEDEVVLATCSWLTQKGYCIKNRCLGTQKGDDIHAHKDGRDLFVECKGSVSKAGRHLKHWQNISGALFNAVRDSVTNRPNDQHSIAIPDTMEYRELIGDLRDFFTRENLSVLWVSGSEKDPHVEAWWNLP